MVVTGHAIILRLGKHEGGDLALNPYSSSRGPYVPPCPSQTAVPQSVSRSLAGGSRNRRCSNFLVVKHTSGKHQSYKAHQITNSLKMSHKPLYGLMRGPVNTMSCWTCPKLFRGERSFYKLVTMIFNMWV